MAANEVKLTIRVGDDGSLDVVAKKAKKAAQAAEQVGRATEQTTNARKKYSKGEKGVAGATSNSTKAFSKMRNEMNGSGGLVGAYATLAANVFALSAAFGVLQRAAAVQQLEQGLTAIGQQSGIAMRSLSNGLKEATGNAIALEEAMRSTSMVIGAGFDSSTLERLGTVARNASIALGRDTADSLARLTRGAVKLEPELLDELGIMVRLDEATEEYAKGIGKTANALTSFEKRQAFMNAVLEEGEKKYKALNDGVATNPYDQLAAAFADLTKSLTKFANDTLKLSAIMKQLADNSYLLAGALLAVGKGAIGAAISALVPALSNVSANLAAGAAGAAKMSANKAKLAATTIKGTKSVNNYAESLSKGERNTKGFNKAMRFGNQSLNSRIGFLKAHVKENGLFNKTTLTKVKGVRDATIAVNSLAMAEYKAATASKAHREQKIFLALETGNFGLAVKRLIGQLKSYKTAAGAAMAQTTLTGKAFIFATATAKGLGLAVRFLGAAFLAMLPHLGLILLALGAIKWAAEALYRKFYETKALKDFTDQAQKTTSVLDELAGAMKKLPEQELFSDQVIARANALNTAVAELDKLIEKYGNLDVEPLDDRLMRNLENYDIRLLLGPMLSIPASLNKEFKNTSIADLIGMTGFQTTSQKATESLQTFINSSKTLKDNFEKIYKGKTLQEVLIGPDGKFDYGLIEEVKEKVIKGEQEKAQELSNVAKAARAAQKALRDYLSSSIVSTDFDEVVTASDDFQKSLSGAADGESVRKLVGEMTSLEQRFYGISDVVSKELVGGFDTIYNRSGYMSMNFDDYLEALRQASAERAKEIAEDRETVALGKARTQNAKNLLDLEKQRTMYTGQSIEVDTLTNNLLDQQVSIIDAQLRQKRTLLSAMSEEEKLSLSGKSLAADIAELESRRAKTVADKIDDEEQIVNQRKEELTILQEQQKGENALLTVQQKRLDALNSMIDSRKKLAEQALREQNARDPQRRRGDTAITPLQEAALMKSVEQDRLKAAADAFNIKVTSIQMEYDLLEAQYKLLKAEAENINAKAEALGKPAPIDTTFLDNAIGGLAKAEEQSLQAAGMAYVAEFRSIMEETAKAGEDALTKSVEGMFSGSAIDRANIFFRDLGASLPEGTEGKGFDGLRTSEQLEAMRGLVTPMIEDLAKLGPQGELVASVTQGAFTIGEAFATAGEKIALIGDGAGSGAAKSAAALEALSKTMSAISDIMNAASQARIAAIDREIAAEKQRDGKSAQSVAKIEALEKKKDKAKKKAFEMNKKMQMAQVAINTAMSISANVAAASVAAAQAGLAAPAVFAGTLGMLNAVTLGLGAAQMAIIASTSYQGGGSIGGGTAGAATSITLGQRKESVDLARSKSARGELAYFRGEAGQGGPEAFTPAFTGYKNRAEGGNTAYMVGEQGPELFVPDRPGRIMPNDDIAPAAPTNVSFNINTIDASGVEDMLVAQRGNIIGMIRQAANSYGQDFVEDVDTSVFTQSAGGVNRY